MPLEASGVGSSWSWCYLCLQAALWVLVAELQSSKEQCLLLAAKLPLPLPVVFLKIKLYVHTLFVLIIIKANTHLHNCDYFYNIKENTCVCCIFFEGIGLELFKT